MRQISHIVSMSSAVGCVLMACILGPCFADAADKAVIENAIRELMPAQSRCERAAWEPLFYCRYATAKTFDVVLDLSTGPGGPSASLTYDAGSSEGHQLLEVIKEYFAIAGISKSKMDQCIAASRLRSAHVVVANTLVRCRHSYLADRVAVELSSEQSDEASIQLGMTR